VPRARRFGLGYHQHVAVAEEAQRVLQLRPLRHGGHPLAEDGLAAGGLRGSQLRFKPGFLVDGKRACVAYQHGEDPLIRA
jgi:hypothetical protein